MAFAHYLQCKATNRFPDDPLVAENASIIDAAMRRAAEIKSDRTRKVEKWQTLFAKQ